MPVSGFCCCPIAKSLALPCRSSALIRAFRFQYWSRLNSATSLPTAMSCPLCHFIFTKILIFPATACRIPRPTTTNSLPACFLSPLFSHLFRRLSPCFCTALSQACCYGTIETDRTDLEKGFILLPAEKRSGKTSVFLFEKTAPDETVFLYCSVRR